VEFFLRALENQPDNDHSKHDEQHCANEEMLNVDHIRIFHANEVWRVGLLNSVGMLSALLFEVGFGDFVLQPSVRVVALFVSGLSIVAVLLDALEKILVFVVTRSCLCPVVAFGFVGLVFFLYAVLVLVFGVVVFLWVFT
jgi:hypothetical protein